MTGLSLKYHVIVCHILGQRDNWRNYLNKQTQ